MLIRKFTSADLDDMIRVGYDAYSDYEDILDSVEKTKTFIDWPIAHGVWVEGELLGSVFGYVDEDIFHFYSIEVAKKHQKQGIGKILMDFLLSEVKLLGFTQVRAYALSEGGRKILTNYGFIKVGERQLEKYVMDIMTLTL